MPQKLSGLPISQLFRLKKLLETPFFRRCGAFDERFLQNSVRIGFRGEEHQVPDFGGHVRRERRYNIVESSLLSRESLGCEGCFDLRESDSRVCRPEWRKLDVDGGSGYYWSGRMSWRSVFLGNGEASRSPM